MATDVVMPQMGESIAEGTIVRWIKKVGEKVDRDEPLFEISTDKVDAEIPSPAAGIVSEIRVKEGETVPVNSVVAVIGSSVTAPADKAAGEATAAPQTSAPSAGRASPKAVEPPKPSPQADGSPASPASTPVATAKPAPVQPAQTAPVRVEEKSRAAPSAAPEFAAATARQASISTEEALQQRSSPLVRKIAKNTTSTSLRFTGPASPERATKDDILAFIGRTRSPGGSRQPTAPGRAGGTGGEERTLPPREARAGRSRREDVADAQAEIAEHMVASRRTSRVHSVFEVNFSRVAQIREAKEGRVRAQRRQSSRSFRSSSRRPSRRCARCRSSTPRSTATASCITRT
jgi:2-oxoglutarate dehydrogenase E2 component (dihydrolipoamide succinyltransferase)